MSDNFKELHILGVEYDWNPEHRVYQGRIKLGLRGVTMFKEQIGSDRELAQVALWAEKAIWGHVRGE